MLLGPLTSQVPAGAQGPAAGALEGREDARLRSLQREAGTDAERTLEVAKKLEAVFASMLVKEMRNASPGSFFGTDSAADVYGGWFDEHVGEKLAERGSLHIAEFVQRLIQSKEGAAQ